MKRSLLILLSLLGLLSQPSYAQEENADALYAAAAPSDSAFVRVINLSDRSISVAMSSKNQAQQIAPGQIGAYRFTAPGPTVVEIDQHKLTPTFEKNSATTYVYDGQSVRSLNDNFINEPKKAQIGFYNLSSQSLALKTADGRHVIVPTLAAGENGNRMVNELKIAFAAYSGEQSVADFPEAFLKKGRTYSYVVLPSATGLRAVSVASTLDPLD